MYGLGTKGEYEGLLELVSLEDVGKNILRCRVLA
jgi:hypothetical protein